MSRSILSLVLKAKKDMAPADLEQILEVVYKRIRKCRALSNEDIELIIDMHYHPENYPEASDDDSAIEESVE